MCERKYTKVYFFQVPSTIAEEKSYNPFMRVTQPSIMKFAKSNDAVETMKVIRQHKDNFKAWSDLFI